MYTDHFGAIEYPHEGMFYKIGVDDSKPLDEQVDEEMPIFECKFDMTEGGSLSTETFRIFFPFDFSKETLVISEGDKFKGIIYGASIEGRTIGIYPSQLGGCTVLLTRI
jgi:hypothetical protein